MNSSAATMYQGDTIQERISNRLHLAPHGHAISFYDPDGSFQWLSFRDFCQRSAVVAGRLRASGLREDKVCVIVLSSEEDAAITLLATLLLGAIPLLVSPPTVHGSLLDLPRVLRRTVRRSEARVVVFDKHLEEMWKELGVDDYDTTYLFGVDHSGGKIHGELSVAERSSDDIAAMQLTSGTTGFPRVCMWKQRAVLAALDGMADAMNLVREDICFNWTPLYHDMGLVNNFLLCLTSGVPLVLFSPHEFVKRPAMWLKGLSDTKATVTWSPNFGFAITTQRARDRQIEGIRLDHVRSFWNAAERIHHQTIVDFHSRFEEYGVSFAALKTNFGCAENIGGATFSDAMGEIVVEHVDRVSLHEAWLAQPTSSAEDAVAVVSAGTPHPGIDVKILSQNGEEVPDGHVGAVALDTPSKMEEYYKDHEATREAFVGDLLLTGDLGYKRNGNLFWVGRVKERITVRGKKLDPSDFEPVLFDVKGLRTGCFVVFGIDDPAKGTQDVVLISEVREPVVRSIAEIEADVLREVFMRLGVSISKVVLVEPRTLAKTSSGKRRHRHFKEAYISGELMPFYLDDGVGTTARVDPL